MRSKLQLLYVCVYIYIDEYTYIYIYVNLYIYMYIRIHTYIACCFKPVVCLRACVSGCWNSGSRDLTVEALFKSSALDPADPDPQRQVPLNRSEGRGKGLKVWV